MSSFFFLTVKTFKLTPLGIVFAENIIARGGGGYSL